MGRNIICDVGNPEDLTIPELEKGLGILLKYVDKCEKKKVKAEEDLQKRPNLRIESESAIAMYESCIQTATELRLIYGLYLS